MEHQEDKPPRGRRRSSAVLGDNPIDTPLTPQEYELSRLVSQINSRDQAERVERRRSLFKSGGYSGNRSEESRSDRSSLAPPDSTDTVDRLLPRTPAPTVKHVSFAGVEAQQVSPGVGSSNPRRSERGSIPTSYRSSRPPIPTPSERPFGSRPQLPVALHSGRERTPGLPALVGHRSSTSPPTSSPPRQPAVTQGASSFSTLPQRPVPIRIGHYLPPPPCYPKPPFPSPPHPLPKRPGSHLPHPLGFPVPALSGETQPRFYYTNPFLERQDQPQLPYQNQPPLQEVHPQTTPSSCVGRKGSNTNFETRTSQSPQFSQPIHVHEPQSTSVELWDPNLARASTSTETFPSFDEAETRTGFEADLGALANFAQTTESSCSTEESDTADLFPISEDEESEGSPSESFENSPDTEERESELSPIGRLVAQSRLRSSSASSDSSFVTVVHSPTSQTPSTRPSTASTATTANSTAKIQFSDSIQDHLRNPTVFTVQLPDSHYKLLETLVSANSDSTEDRAPLFGDSARSSFEESQYQAHSESQGREGTKSRLDHREARYESRCIRRKSLIRSDSEESISPREERFNQLFPGLSTSKELQKLKDRVRARSRSTSQSSTLSKSSPSTTSEPYSVLSSDQRIYRGAESQSTRPTPTRKSCRYYDMNYQNYVDQPGGSGASPRQAPPSPSQGVQHTNGMNGGMGMGGGIVGYPTPAGHQSDLNMVMQMVEELSGLLQNNQRLTAGVVDKIGKVREKALHHNLSNDELIQVVATELNEDSKNLERENSELRKALDKAEYDKKENFKLACHGANILADITEKMHAFKEQHEADTLAWHRNYRKQLADEREENLQLRNQINDMIAAAARANGHLRDMRKWLTDHDELNELKIQNIHLRQEKRFWKRLALPLIQDGDSEWSDDDDLIDPEEKKRLAAIDAEKKRKEKEEAEGGGESAAA